ncbi:hypothetical protein MMC21_008492, partial [Puttea exsequens]|nr:hypothetical protein [Puttea exsequens]
MLKPSRSTCQDRFCETLGGRSAHLKVVRFFRVSSFLVEERALQDFFVAQWAFRSDPQRRPTVVSLIDTHLRLYPVGRLDIDTTGLLLLTNDGELAHRLTHPSFEVPRTYQATLGGPPITDKAIRELRTGVVLEDGRTAPARVK